MNLIGNLFRKVTDREVREKAVGLRFASLLWWCGIGVTSSSRARAPPRTIRTTVFVPVAPIAQSAKYRLSDAGGLGFESQTGRATGKSIPSLWRDKHAAIKSLRPPELHAGKSHPDHKKTPPSQNEQDLGRAKITGCSPKGCSHVPPLPFIICAESEIRQTNN